MNDWPLKSSLLLMVREDVICAVRPGKLSCPDSRTDFVLPQVRAASCVTQEQQQFVKTH